MLGVEAAQSQAVGDDAGVQLSTCSYGEAVRGTGRDLSHEPIAPGSPTRLGVGFAVVEPMLPPLAPGSITCAVRFAVIVPELAEVPSCP